MVTENSRFALDLARFGPESDASAPIPLAEAERYCRRLAASHYENFSVISRLLPRSLRQPFCNVYAYCRWADDLADEVSSTDRSEALLDWWQSLLDGCFGRSVGANTGADPSAHGASLSHPVFVALGETIQRFDLPCQPFADLLTAFRRDQRVTHYQTVDELLDYCRDSACPVGRIVLRLGRCDDPRNVELSDWICSGLQWINFCQDVRRDFERGRVYLPKSQRERFGCTDEMLAGHVTNDAFRRLLAREVERAESMLRRGWPLVENASPLLRPQVELFVRGGLEVARAIRRIDFDVWRTRPVVSRWTQLRLSVACWGRTQTARLRSER